MDQHPVVPKPRVINTRRGLLLYPVKPYISYFCQQFVGVWCNLNCGWFTWVRLTGAGEYARLCEWIVCWLMQTGAFADAHRELKNRDLMTRLSNNKYTFDKTGTHCIHSPGNLPLHYDSVDDRVQHISMNTSSTNT